MKTLHPSASGRALRSDEPAWPPLPWVCSACGQLFSDHALTVATIADGEPTTFYCAPCDFLRYMNQGLD